MVIAYTNQDHNFLGKLVKLGNNDLLVSCLTRTSGGKFKWKKESRTELVTKDQVVCSVEIEASGAMRLANEADIIAKFTPPRRK